MKSTIILVVAFLTTSMALSAATLVVGFPSKLEAVAFCKEAPAGYSGFKQGPTGLFLIPAKFEQRSSPEDFHALDLEITDARPKTCWFLETALDFPILVKGLTLQGTPALMKDFIGLIKPKERKNVIIASEKYSLTFPKVISPNFQCALGEEAVDLDGGGYEIILAADLNADGLPDFILQNAKKYSYKQYQILMSDQKEKKCRVAATQEVYSC